MDTSFIYHKDVSDKNYLNRKDEEHELISTLRKKENCCLYAYPKYGFTSLIYKCLSNLKKEEDFLFLEFDILDCRSIENLELKFSQEFNKLYNKNISTFNEAFNLSVDFNKHLFIIINEFQNILYFEELYKFIKDFNLLLSTQQTRISFIISGSQTNAMKEIFVYKKYFYKQFKQINLGEESAEKIIDYIIKGFLVGGKVIDKTILYPICTNLRCNLWYINQFCSITDFLSKGYIPESILKEAFQRLIASHHNYFVSLINLLTTYQLYLLTAISHGIQKFSTVEVINKYNLNSSANVKRLKDALIKKEIISFDNENKAYFIDPLFEYWFKKYYLHLD